MINLSYRRMPEGFSLNHFSPRNRPGEDVMDDRLKEDLEASINRSFATRGMGLAENYFRSPLFTQHFSHMVELHDNGGGKRKRAGGVIDLEMITESGIPYVLHNLVWIEPEYRGRELLDCIMYLADGMGANLALRKREPDYSGIRSTSEKALGKYAEWGGSLFKLNGPGNVQYPYTIGVFGASAWDIARQIAEHIASVPRTTYHISPPKAEESCLLVAGK